MAWSWSHTEEAYQMARRNLGRKSITFLAECYAEWKCREVADALKLAQEPDECPLNEAVELIEEIMQHPEHVSRTWRGRAEMLLADIPKSKVACPNQRLAENGLPDVLCTDPLLDGRRDKFIKEAREIAAKCGKEHLADWVWMRAEEQATCDNGGYELWMCPTGCHFVEC
jgi:hypothetical protein